VPRRGVAARPAEVKRAVWVRDLGRCAFVGTDGRRCNERVFVEFYYVRPYAVGGEAMVENIQLWCRRHNGYEARAFFDRGWEADGGGVLRELRALYGSEPTAVICASGFVSRRVRVFLSDDASIAAVLDKSCASSA
jgi:hypothetical protein